MVPTAVKSSAPSKSQLAYEYIRSRIDDGHFVSGFRLVLGAIANELDISVVPVREAIRRLEAEGLVTFEKNVGAQVALINEAEYSYTMETLALVEGAATAASAPLLTTSQLDRARATNQELAACLTEFVPHTFTELNHQFHSVLFEQCPNPHILDLVHRGWKRLTLLRDSTFGFIPGRARESVKEHAEILALIESGADARTVEFHAREHRLATLRAFQQHQASRTLSY